MVHGFAVLRRYVSRHPVAACGVFLALLLFVELSLRVFQVPMKITWLPEIAGYDFRLTQYLYARRSPVEYGPGVYFSVP